MNRSKAMRRLGVAVEGRRETVWPFGCPRLRRTMSGDAIPMLFLAARELRNRAGGGQGGEARLRRVKGWVGVPGLDRGPHGPKPLDVESDCRPKRLAILRTVRSPVRDDR